MGVMTSGDIFEVEFKKLMKVKVLTLFLAPFAPQRCSIYWWNVEEYGLGKIKFIAAVVGPVEGFICCSAQNGSS